MTFKPRDRENAKNKMHKKNKKDILQYYARHLLGSELSG